MASDGFFLSSPSNNVVYMKCEIRWAFVHGSQTSSFSATLEVQKNMKPLSHNTLCSSGSRGGALALHSILVIRKKAVFCLGCVTLYLLLQLHPSDQVLPLVTLSGAYRRVQQRDKFGPLFVSKHPGNDMSCLIRQHKRK